MLISYHVRRFYCAAIFACVLSIGINAHRSSPSNEHARVTLLNTNEKLLLQQLDQLKSIAQYLLQLTYKNPQQKSVRVWLSSYINKISTLQRTPLYPISEEKLNILAFNTLLFTDQLDRLLETNLASPPHNSKKSLLQRTLEDIEADVQDNEDHIEQMREKARQAGLTLSNKFFRLLDVILPSPTELICTGLLTALALNALPKKLLNLRQRILGTQESLTETHNYHLIPIPKEEPDGLSLMGKFVIRTIGLFALYSQSSKAMEILPVATQKSLKYLGNEFYRVFQNKWEDLKGNDAGIMPSTYETIENLTLEDDDLIGLEDQKNVILSLINYLIDPELFIRQGTKIEKGILFTGPSRSGKTALAKRIAGQVNKMFAERGMSNRVLFREIRPHELWQEGSIKNIIEEVKERRQPCIIFIDEFHAIGVQTHQDKTKLADALTALEDLHQLSNFTHPIFIIGATNRPDLLDPALLTHERFGNTLRFSLPTPENRKKFFETKLARIAANPKEFDLEELSHKTEHCSYGDLQKVFNAARLATNNVESIKQHHLTTAIDHTIRGILNSIPSELRTKHIIAAHQAGYALAYTLLEPYEHLDIVTIQGVTQKIFEVNEWTETKSSDRKIKQHDILYGAYFTYRDDEQMASSDKDDMLKQVKIRLSGKIAEDILLGSHSLTYHGLDSSDAFDIAKIILLDGFLEKDLSKRAAQHLADDAQKLVKDMEEVVHQLFVENKDALKAIFDALEEHHYLTAHDIKTLINQRHQ